MASVLILLLASGMLVSARICSPQHNSEYYKAQSDTGKWVKFNLQDLITNIGTDVETTQQQNSTTQTTRATIAPSIQCSNDKIYIDKIADEVRNSIQKVPMKPIVLPPSHRNWNITIPSVGLCSQHRSKPIAVKVMVCAVDTPPAPVVKVWSATRVMVGRHSNVTTSTVFITVSCL